MNKFQHDDIFDVSLVIIRIIPAFFISLACTCISFLAPYFFLSLSLSICVSPHPIHNSQPPSHPRSQSYLPAILPNYSSHSRSTHLRNTRTRIQYAVPNVTRNMVKKISRSTSVLNSANLLH